MQRPLKRFSAAGVLMGVSAGLLACLPVDSLSFLLEIFWARLSACMLTCLLACLLTCLLAKPLAGLCGGFWGFLRLLPGSFPMIGILLMAVAPLSAALLRCRCLLDFFLFFFLSAGLPGVLPIGSFRSVLTDPPTSFLAGSPSGWLASLLRPLLDATTGIPMVSSTCIAVALVA